MKTIKFGFFGEDVAHKIFVKNYLQTFQISHQINFQMDDVFCEKYVAKNKKEVENRFEEVIQIGLSHYLQDLFIIGRDMDTPNKKEFKRKFDTLQSKIWKQFQSKTCIFLPVQCIEHWLLYLKWNQENPNSTKNIDIERKPNHEAKLELYKKPKATNKITIPIVENLTQNFSVDWLMSRSESFVHFNQQVINFLK